MSNILNDHLSDCIAFSRSLFFTWYPTSITSQFILLLSEIYLFFIFCFLIFIILVFSVRKSCLTKQHYNVAKCFSFLLLLILFNLIFLYLNSVGNSFFLDVSLHHSSLIFFLKIFLILLFSIYVYNLQQFELQFETGIYLFINFLSLLYLLSVTTFLSFFLCIELFSFSTYILLIYKQNSISAIESGLKYFILGSIISCWLLFSLCGIYFLYGITTFNDYTLFFFIPESVYASEELKNFYFNDLRLVWLEENETLSDIKSVDTKLPSYYYNTYDSNQLFLQKCCLFSSPKYTQYINFEFYWDCVHELYEHHYTLTPTRLLIFKVDILQNNLIIYQKANIFQWWFFTSTDSNLSLKNKAISLMPEWANLHLNGNVLYNYNNFYYWNTLCVLLILLYLAFKLSAAPFHIWSIDVYMGTNFFIFFYLVLIPKLTLLFFFIKLCYIYFHMFTPVWTSFSLVLGICSIIVGAFGAIFQSKIKKFWIYSTINNLGFLFLLLTHLSFFTLLTLSIYLFIYFSIMLGFMLIFSTTTDSTKLFRDNLTFSGTWEKCIKQSYLYMPLSCALSLLLFSIGGLPPLAGFLNKFYFYQSLWFTNYQYVVYFILFSTILSIFYYFRIIKHLFFTESINWVYIKPLSKINALILSILVSAQLFLFFNSEFFLKFTENLLFNLFI